MLWPMCVFTSFYTHLGLCTNFILNFQISQTIYENLNAQYNRKKRCQTIGTVVSQRIIQNKIELDILFLHRNNNSNAI